MYGYKKKRSFSFLRGEESVASCGWLFVDNVPLLCDRRRVARQLQVETWLDLAQLMGELEINGIDVNKRNTQPATSYII
jgi:hypothetical protein